MQFSLFNLVFCSELDIGISSPHINNKEIDVEILYGDVPDKIENPIEFNRFHQINENELLLRMPHLGNYYIVNGRKIIVDRENGKPESVAVVIGAGFSAILHQRKLFHLHASAVSINGKGIIIAGNPGTGKSTIVASLIQKYKAKLISDEITAIEFINNEPIILPGIPLIKLWEDSCEQLNIDYSKLTQIRANIRKYLYSPEEFELEQIRPNKFFVLKLHDNDTELKSELSFFEGFKLVGLNSYKSISAVTAAQKELLFKHQTMFAKLIPVVELYRNRSGVNSYYLADKIIEYIL